MTRIAVVGICQARGIGDALSCLLQDADVIILEAPSIRGRGALEEASSLLEDRDIVFAQALPDDYGPLSTDALRLRFPALAPAPALVFSGFHPDCIYMISNGQEYASPVGAYHSAIVAAAFSLGVPVERVPSLFNAFVFRKAGYFDEFAKATEYIRLMMLQFDLDIEPEWSDWIAHAPFMHTINHPKAYALAGVAKLVAAKAGLISKTAPTPEMPYDSLSVEAVWPVYPELARPIGLEGNYVFKRPERLKPEMGGGVLMNLRSFVDESYALYSSYPRRAFEADAVVRISSVLENLLR